MDFDDDMMGLDDFDDEVFDEPIFTDEIDDTYINEQIQIISPVDEGKTEEGSEINLLDASKKTEGKKELDIDLNQGFEVSEINLDAILGIDSTQK